MNEYCDVCKTKLNMDDIRVTPYFGLAFSDIMYKICPKCEPEIYDKIKHILSFSTDLEIKPKMKIIK